MDTISTVGPLPYSSAHPHPRLGARLGQVSENPRKVDEKPPCMKQFPNTAHANRHKFGICDSHYSKPTPTTSKSQPSKPTPRTSQSQPSNLGDWIGQLTKSGQTTGSRDKAAQETRSIGSGSNTGHQTRSESNSDSEGEAGNSASAESHTGYPSESDSEELVNEGLTIQDG